MSALTVDGTTSPSYGISTTLRDYGLLHQWIAKGKATMSFYHSIQNLDKDRLGNPKAAGMQYTLPWNFLNWCPVMNVPAGLSDQNMPVGMQIIGKPYDLETVLRVGKAFSKGGLKLYVGDKFPQVR